MTTFTITVGLKPNNHPSYGRGSKFCFYIDNIPGKPLVLTPGTNYIFNINTPGHPFYFTTSESGGSEDNSVLSGFPPTDKGTIQFTLPTSYPTSFYYQCKIHPYMGNTVSISHNTFYVNPILTGLVAPTSLASPDTEHIYVADQVGLVYKHNLTTQETSSFLDVRQYIPTLNPDYDERGLLGLCFHPNFQQNGHFYIYYSTVKDYGVNDHPGYTSQTNQYGNNNQSMIQSGTNWQQSGDQSKDNKEKGYYNCLSQFTILNSKILYQEEKVILRILKDFTYHNGGKIGFGPDGYLYLTTGDSGSQGDKYGRAQNLSLLHGKILRIDINTDTYPYYRIPPDNPFIGINGSRPEIWAYGFRNPWGLDFTTDGRGNTLLIVSDAGYESGSGQEEINIVARGANCGWNLKEGSRLASWKDAPKGDISGMIDPIFSYTTSDPAYADSDTSVVIGGYIDKGGDYICADFSGRLIRLRFTTTGANVVETAKLGPWIRSFGKDGTSNLYVLTSQNQGPKGTTGNVLALTVV